MAPSIAVGAAAFGEVARWNDDDGEAAGAPLGLSTLRLGVHYAGTGTVRQAGGGATFDWAVLGVEGCFVRIRLARRADVHGCAVFDVGVLRAQGEEIPAPEGPIRPWLSAAPVLRIQWFIASSWFLDVEGLLVVPLRRDTFVFENPPRTFHAVPPVGARAGLGLGYQFGDRGRGLRP